MGSLYRPSTKTKAQEAAAALSPERRKSEDERQLILLRTIMQQTIWKLDPKSDLAIHLQETMDEIRRHNLATLFPASSCDTYQEMNVDGTSSTAIGDSNVEEPVACIEAPKKTSHKTVTDDNYENEELVRPEVPEKGAAANENQAATRKRAMDDDETTIPLAKRVRTWIGGVFASRT
ncbi:uncharacterized protein FTJAE_5024 [Fusarium tjaetaba]|uniref:Uncharacterized protein n=1 Tax=Fusarium tjaetaba TaxID=1567544 RepID=A0A8H5RSV7_9HYPO|nr:uncharacterized protein FTJAE_5024 [Fusarium tjaetaba]KAF5638953.1 hypothetical protein FTJAE_5024 [Fusarium tjaetaba]